ncbi:hypothetical protein [Burkholderia cenocepacia]|uniref:hypothetical protein n=1 Tax=Burkholderia cenocepacia TaxID=95486 RepID=UPI000760DC10|nr:hypothetical protein [Burkholderia cenocepacia]KWU17963.1 hypothetical protein AS149_14915 [Burkholderia cenocepacia]
MTMLRFLDIVGQLAALAVILHEVRFFSQAVLVSATFNEKMSRGARVTLAVRLRVFVLRYSWNSLFLSDLSKAIRKVPNFGALRTSSAFLSALTGAPLAYASGGFSWSIAGLATCVALFSYFSAHVWLLTYSERYQHSRLIQSVMAADARVLRNTA